MSYRLSDKATEEKIGICCMCGQPITEEDIASEAERMQRYFKKWKIHPKCFEFVNKKLDAESR